MSFRRSASAGAMRRSDSAWPCSVAVDAEADLQAVFLRLDMDVGGADLGRVLEQRLQQLDHRRVLGAESGAERAEVDQPSPRPRPARALWRGR